MAHYRIIGNVLGYPLVIYVCSLDNGHCIRWWHAPGAKLCLLVRSKLLFYNVLTTSINNTHIKRKNSKTICCSETFSSRIFGSAPNSPNTRCLWFDWVGFTSLWHNHRKVHSVSSTFTFFKRANCTQVAYRVYITRYLGNAMRRRFSISAPSIYSVCNARCELNLPTVLNMKLPAAETDYWSGISQSYLNWPLTGIEVRKTVFLQLRSKNKIWSNANIICIQKNKRKKCSKQLTKYPFKDWWRLL
jgi:hypothetical protein